MVSCPQDNLRDYSSKYKHCIIIFRTFQGYFDHYVEKKPKHLTPELNARLSFLCFGKTPFICVVLFQGTITKASGQGSRYLGGISK